MWFKRLIILFVIVMLGGSAYWSWWYFSIPRVSYLTLQLDEAVETLLVSGRVIGDGAVPLSLEQPGQVMAVAVQEGDLVAEGDILANLDGMQAEDLVLQSESDLESARLALGRLKNRDLPQARENLTQASRQAELADRIYEETYEEKYAPILERLERAEEDEQEARRRYEEKEKLYSDGEMEIEDFREAGTEWDQVKAELAVAQEEEKVVAREVERLEAERDIVLSRYRSARSVLAALENEDIRQARLNITQAENRLKQARRSLDNTDLRAPFAGLIAAVNVNPGQYINTGQEILTIIPDPDRTYLEAQVDEEFTGDITVGQDIKVSSSAFQDRTFSGRVDRVSPTVDPSRGTFKVRFVLEQYEPDLLPDLSASIEIVTERNDQSLIIEQGYTFWEDNLLYVFVAEDDIASLREIKVEDLGRGNYLVKEGLSPGELVLADTGLEDGQRIRLND